jgi:phage shock protein PspC (stress-responsive transcriptional regulator)
MQKVISISLNGNAYQLDEPAYEALRTYLADAERALGDDPDRAEILRDLEQAVADKCLRFLNAQKTVLTAAEIQQIIVEMGPVEGHSADEHANASTPRSEGEPKSRPSGKRLYLIRDGAMIAGVCNGLAAYFDIDVTFVRLAFIVLTVLTKGLGILAYIVLMFVVPHATTSEQEAAALGIPFTAQELIDRAKKQYAAFARDKDAWRRRWTRQQRRWERQWRRQSRYVAAAPPEGGPWYPPPAPLFAWPGVFAPMFAVLNAALFIVLAVSIVSVVNTGTVFGFPLPAGLPVWAAILIMILIFNVLSAPLHPMRRIGMVPPGGPSGAWVELWGAVLWLACVGATIWLAFQHQAEIREFIHRLPGVWASAREAFRAS